MIYQATHKDGATCRVTREQVLVHYAAAIGDREMVDPWTLRCKDWFFRKVV